MAFRNPLSLSARFLLFPTASTALLLTCQQQQQQQRSLRPSYPHQQHVTSGTTLRCDAPARKRTAAASGLDARVVRQISTGSLLGLVSGAVVAYLSKPLAIVFGLLFAGVQYLEYRGIHLVPYGSLQRFFGDIDLKSAVQDDPALKVSFGLTFALAGFGSLEQF